MGKKLWLKEIKYVDELIYSQFLENKNNITYVAFKLGFYNEITDSLMWFVLFQVNNFIRTFKLKF